MWNITDRSTYKAIFVLLSSGYTVFLLFRNCFTARKININEVTEVKNIFIKLLLNFIIDLTKV